MARVLAIAGAPAFATISCEAGPECVFRIHTHLLPQLVWSGLLFVNITDRAGDSRVAALQHPGLC